MRLCWACHDDGVRRRDHGTLVPKGLPLDGQVLINEGSGISRRAEHFRLAPSAYCTSSSGSSAALRVAMSSGRSRGGKRRSRPEIACSVAIHRRDGLWPLEVGLIVILRPRHGEAHPAPGKRLSQQHLQLRVGRAQFGGGQTLYRSQNFRPDPKRIGALAGRCHGPSRGCRC